MKNSKDIANIVIHNKENAKRKAFYACFSHFFILLWKLARIIFNSVKRINDSFVKLFS